MRTAPAVTRRVRGWYDSPWQIVARALGAAATIVAVLVVLAVGVVPRLLGGSSLTVLSGSMEPALSPGDMVAVRGIDTDDVCREISIGDIVTYLPTPGQPDLVTHRVTGIALDGASGTDAASAPCTLTVQGDANNAPDAPVLPQQVRGVFLYGIPAIGWVSQWVFQNPVMAAAAGILILGVASGASTLSSRRARSAAISAALAGASQTAPTRPPFAPAGPVAAPRSAPAPLMSDQAYDRDLALRERALAVREREVAVREHELGLGRGALVTTDGREELP